MIAVTGFEPIRVGGFRSDVLVLGVLTDEGVVLLRPDQPVAPGDQSPEMPGLGASLRPPQPLSRRELGILALFSVVAFTTGWSGSAITHALPFIQDDLGLSDAASLRPAGHDPGSGPGRARTVVVGGSRGRRRPMLIGFVLLTTGNLITALLPFAAGVAVSQSIARIGTIGLGALAVVVLAEEVEPAVRGYAIGVFVFFASVGPDSGSCCVRSPTRRTTHGACCSPSVRSRCSPSRC